MEQKDSFADISWGQSLSAVDTKSFAYKIVQKRMPVILKQVVDHLVHHKGQVSEAKSATAEDKENYTNMADLNNTANDAEEELTAILEELVKLENELHTNKPITRLAPKNVPKDCSFLADLDEWNAAISSSMAKNIIAKGAEPKWFESGLLFVECYMYRRIMAAIHDTKHHKYLDPFKWLKSKSLDNDKQSTYGMLDYLNSSLESIAQADDTAEEELKGHFERLLRLSVWGNKGDLSHTAEHGQSSPQVHEPHDVQHKMREKLVIDHSDFVWRHLLQTRSHHSQPASPVRVDIVCDNYGVELIADLILGEFLIVSRLATQVCYHVKAMPWLVSDTTVQDFFGILEVVNEHSGQFGDKWSGYLEKGIFVVTTDPFWTLPYDFAWMPRKAPKLYEYFQGSNLVIFKGDLNYRKLTGDLVWPHTTPFRTALRSFHPAALCALRGLKSEVVVGLEKGQAEARSLLDDNWLVSGDFALIQFLFSE